jgi:hypothetical protein
MCVWLFDRIRRQRHTRFASRIMSYNNSNNFKSPPRGVYPEDIFCQEISTAQTSPSSKSLSFRPPYSPSKSVSLFSETVPNTPLSMKSAASVSPSKGSQRPQFSFDEEDADNLQQLMNDLNLFLWNEGGLFNIWSSAAVLLSSSPSNNPSQRLHSHELTKTSSLMAYSLKFKIISRCLPDEHHRIFTEFKTLFSPSPKLSSPKRRTNSFKISWCLGEANDPWEDIEAVTMIQDLLSAVGIQNAELLNQEEDSYQLYWLEGRLPNSFLYEDSDDRFLVLVNLVTHTEVSKSSSVSLTSSRIAGIHVTSALHQRLVHVVDHCLPTSLPTSSMPSSPMNQKRSSVLSTRAIPLSINV